MVDMFCCCIVVLCFVCVVNVDVVLWCCVFVSCCEVDVVHVFCVVSRSVLL